jgi:CheY-like chemotaxis protein/nitrogen-specific signal transduction histidine kinase
MVIAVKPFTPIVNKNLKRQAAIVITSRAPKLIKDRSQFPPGRPPGPPNLDLCPNTLMTTRRPPKAIQEPATTTAMLKAAADIFSEALFLIDRSHRIILANNAAQKLTSLEESNLVGQQIESILLLEHPDTQIQITTIPLSTTELVILRAKIHAQLHSATFLPLHYIPYFKAFKPRPISLAIVTPHVSTETQDHTSSTIQTNILGQLVMRIAHDFSNSLTAIIGNAELIEEHISTLLHTLPTANPESIATYLDQALPEIQDVVRTSREMAQFIQTLQEYAKQQPTTGHTLDLNTAIAETITMARSLLGRKIQIEFLPSDDLPQIYIDRLRIDQILLSILVHSKKTMSAGGHITIQTEPALIDNEFVTSHPGAREGNYTRLSLTDTSAGMDSETLKRIFDFPTSKRPSDPGRLELPTVYSVLKQFNGYIDVESWPGKGTRFDIYIPQTPTTNQTSITIVDDEEVLYLHLSREPNESASTAQNVLPNGSLILLAEDDTAVRNYIERHLRKAGYEVMITNDGTSALELYRQLSNDDTQPALLITDLGLPGMDGRTLCSTIRETYPTAPVLLTSGYRIDLDGSTKKTPEGFDFLQKPFAPNILLTTIERILSKASL